MRNTVIDASRLAGEVSELRKAVEGLRSEVESLRQSNRWLDQSLVDAREARDAEHAKVIALQNEKASLEHEVRITKDTAEYHKSAHQSLAEMHKVAAKDRDDAMLRQMELEEENKKLQEKLTSIAKLFEQPKAEPIAPVEEYMLTVEEKPHEPTEEPRKVAFGNW